MIEHKRRALITGASAGIGAAFAHFLARQGYDLILVARREDRLADLAIDLWVTRGVRCDVIAVDLSKPGAAKAVFDRVQAQGLHVDLLVNNASLSGDTRFTDSSWPDLAAEIQLMVTSMTELIHLFVPAMKDRHWGRIINLSSLAAFSPPGASRLYTGIKSYVLNMSEALNMELQPLGINVTALCPGITHADRNDDLTQPIRTSKLPRLLWQHAEDVACDGYAAVMRGKAFCVPGIRNKLMAACMRPLPEGLRYQLGYMFSPVK
jgi:short-subunit dehydrogenase